MKSERDVEAMLKAASFTPKDSLKTEILKKAQSVSAAPVPKPKRAFLTVKQLSALAACLLLVGILLFGGIRYEDYGSVCLDVNPSVELLLNRFGTVHTVICHNDDAQTLFSELALSGKSIETALPMLLDTLNTAGYLHDGAEVCLTAVSNHTGKAEKLLEKLSNEAEKHAAEKGYRVSFSTQILTKEEREYLKEIGVSPAKYRLIHSILSLDSSYTFDELKNLSMKDLRALWKELSKKESQKS
ncbi:MAG: hypothetical protein IKC63_00160 [Clostridia bacterium]|nr:hypothetical protein [Clostridia bacterium]